MKHNVVFTGEGGSVRVSSVEKLLKENEYVGFQSTGEKFRYFVSGGKDGLSPVNYIVGIRPDGYWPNPWPRQGQFYTFDSKKELLNWMAEEKQNE